MNKPSIVWFRRDLRLQDNPALQKAVENGGPVLPVYIWDPSQARAETPGAAGRVWLHHSLRALQSQFQRRKIPLLIRKGDPGGVLNELIERSGAAHVYWNRRYEPDAHALDASMESSLRTSGVDARGFNASLLFEPREIRNKSGKPFQVFTPFWKHCLTRRFNEPVSVDASKWIAWKGEALHSLAVEGLNLLPERAWHESMMRGWQVGEDRAAALLEAFCRNRIDSYSEQRDNPALLSTSRLSPHLHFGEIGPRQIAAKIRPLLKRNRSAFAFFSQIGWREFAHCLLYHYPHTLKEPLRETFTRFPWRENKRDLEAWQRGLTGYPMVDAGMRELWATGWMHNRVRMIVASFLVKHLLQPWQAGAAWFEDTLVDADLANNTLGWQWTAGCGADAAPYFRIFNPVSQGEKFDAEGDYVRRWIPEISNLPNRYIHAPWKAEERILKDAKLRLGEDYPQPIVDHATARNRALEAYQRVKS